MQLTPPFGLNEACQGAAKEADDDEDDDVEDTAALPESNA